MKLNIGCGQEWLPDCLNVDREGHAKLCEWARAAGKPEPVIGAAEFLQYDLTLNWPWPSDSVDGILADNFLEHLGHQELTHLLREALRVLKTGASLTGQVPDFARVWQHYLDDADYAWEPLSTVGPYEKPAENALYNYCYGWGHKQIFTAPMLEQRLTRAGFATVVATEERHVLRFMATKVERVVLL